MVQEAYRGWGQFGTKPHWYKGPREGTAGRLDLKLGMPRVGTKTRVLVAAETILSADERVQRKRSRSRVTQWGSGTYEHMRKDEVARDVRGS